MREKLHQSEKMLFSRILFEKGPDALDKWLDSLASRPTDECILEQIASLHAGHNLFTFLVDVRGEDVRPALNLVLNATKLLHHFDLSDVINLFRFAHNLELAFLFYVEQALEHIFEIQPEFTGSMLEELRKYDLLSPNACLLWASLYIRCSGVDSLEYLRHESHKVESDYLIRVALFVHMPENLRLDSPAYREAIAAIMPDVQRVMMDHSDLYAAWSALCLASEFSEQAAIDVQSVPGLANPVAQYALLQWIAKRSAARLTCLEIPVSQLLIPISKIAISDESVRHSFDATMSQLVRQASTRSEVCKVLGFFLEADVDINKFKLLMHAIGRDHDFFAQVLSEWLTSVDANLAAVSSMLRGCVAEQYPCRLDSEVLKKAEASGRKRAAMRLLAWTHNAPSLMKFAEDLAEDPHKQPDGLVWADAIIVHLVAEYPMSSAEWLVLKSSQQHGTEFNALYLYHRDRAVSYRDALIHLPQIRELTPTSQQHLAMRQCDVRNRRQIDQAAREKSIFSQFAGKVHVMQGKRFATVMPDGNVSISDMAEFSFSIELPISERADPVGALKTRLDYLGNTR